MGPTSVTSSRPSSEYRRNIYFISLFAAARSQASSIPARSPIPFGFPIHPRNALLQIYIQSGTSTGQYFTLPNEYKNKFTRITRVYKMVFPPQQLPFHLSSSAPKISTLLRNEFRQFSLPEMIKFILKYSKENWNRALGRV